MPSITLENVHVEFPIYDGRARSLRNRILAGFRSERIDLAKAGRVVIRGLIDVNLKFAAGDRVGIIGRNGSGKSTLLRVLAGIYVPSAGTARIEGSVAALLDMMLGMDMDSTGYENMVLRGLALGLNRAQIRAVEEDVGSFSGLGGHLHLPAQTYSSGMLLRLAFAMSTAYTREILLIDEVIGAGDAEFIGRARQRLHDLAQRSAVVIVASHSPTALQEMCESGLVMDAGRVRYRGPIDDALKFYEEEIQKKPKRAVQVAVPAPAAAPDPAPAPDVPARQSGTAA